MDFDPVEEVALAEMVLQADFYYSVL